MVTRLKDSYRFAFYILFELLGRLESNKKVESGFNNRLFFLNDNVGIFFYIFHQTNAIVIILFLDITTSYNAQLYSFLFVLKKINVAISYQLQAH